MHSQKNSEIKRDLTETSCPLVTACLQHLEGLARPQISVGTIRSSATEHRLARNARATKTAGGSRSGPLVAARSQPVMRR